MDRRGHHLERRCPADSRPPDVQCQIELFRVSAEMKQTIHQFGVLVGEQQETQKEMLIKD